MKPWPSTRCLRKFQWPANGLWGRPVSIAAPPFFCPVSGRVIRLFRLAIIFLHAHPPSVVHSLLMAQQDKLLERILLGASDANIGFEELCQLLRRLASIIHEGFYCNRRYTAATRCKRGRRLASGRARPSDPPRTVSSTPRVLEAPRARLAWRLRGFVTNPHE